MKNIKMIFTENKKRVGQGLSHECDNNVTDKRKSRFISARELEIMNLMDERLSNKEISTFLSSHKKEIYSRYDTYRKAK
jgi:ATP/maltotriose-dependent transcriptional regulator MalT